MRSRTWHENSQEDLDLFNARMAVAVNRSMADGARYAQLAAAAAPVTSVPVYFHVLRWGRAAKRQLHVWAAGRTVDVLSGGQYVTIGWLEVATMCQCTGYWKWVFLCNGVCEPTRECGCLMCVLLLRRANTKISGGNVPRKRVTDQIAVLNKHFASVRRLPLPGLMKMAWCMLCSACWTRVGLKNDAIMIFL